MTKKNILFIESGTGYGGTGKYLFELVKRLDTERFKPYVIYCGEGTNIAKIKDLGITTSQLNLTIKNTGSPVLINYCYMLFWFIFTAIPNSFRILRVIKKHQIDVVYLNNEILTHVPSIIAAVVSKRKIICHNHGLRGLTFLERIFAKFVDLYICVSNGTREEVEKSLTNKRMEVVHNGLDIKEYDSSAIGMDESLKRLKEANKLVGMSGRIVEWKGHEVFIRAADKVADKRDCVKFIIIGDDLSSGKVFLKKLKQLVIELGLGENVIFTGWTDDPLNFVNCLDISVQPSIEPEPFGLSVIEAMALKKPVIGSRLGALPEIIGDGVDGFLFKPGDPQDLAEKIIHLLDDPDKCEEIGRMAREKVENSFKLDTNINRVQELIAETVKDVVGRMTMR